MRVRMIARMTIDRIVDDTTSRGVIGRLEIYLPLGTLKVKS